MFPEAVQDQGWLGQDKQNAVQRTAVLACDRMSNCVLLHGKTNTTKQATLSDSL